MPGLQLCSGAGGPHPDGVFRHRAVTGVQQLRTPLLRLAGASVLIISAPGSRMFLPAVPAAQAGALAHALAEELL